MGLSSSKHNGAASSSSPASSSSVITRKTRSYTSRLLNHSCLRSYPQVSDGPTPRTSVHGQCAIKTVPKEETYESCGRVNDEHELRGQVRTGCMPFEVRKPSTNFLSRFNCLSGNVNFMMKRTNDFGSSKPYMLPESLNNEFEPSTSASQPTRSLDEELVTHNSRKGKSKKSVRVGAGVECDENLVFESRIPGEIIESNARFSRTLSVGRLRDRGLISRVPFPDINSSQQQGRDSSNEAGPSSSVHGTLNNIAELQQVQYHHPQEYRSTFLERRRRIRSQVRALQRIGSQFGNISGHELTCILSGQHQRGHCTCNITLADQNNKTSSGANVSRIVMLAEALFEVLDEIQQQSLALSSRPALSSIGSVPAPPDVVELLPVRSCREMQDNFQDDATQCYICLIEYEQGDSLRILPCHHNFHKACIDKWLKEIHRVCPLCRGDVCKTDKLRVADM